MWQGSFPRPTPDSKKSGIGFKSGDIIDMSVFNIAVPSQLEIATTYTNNYPISIWNKYAIFNANVWDVSDPLNPAMISGLSRTEALQAINDEYYYFGSGSQNGYIMAQNIIDRTSVTVAQTSGQYYYEPTTDGENLYFGNYDNNNHFLIHKASKDGKNIIWSKTLDETAYNNGAFVYITTHTDPNCTYFYAYYNNANGLTRVYKINKSTGQTIAKSVDLQYSYMPYIDLENNELYITYANLISIYDGSTFELKKQLNLYTAGVVGASAVVYEVQLTKDYIYVRVASGIDYTGLIRRSNFTPIANTFNSQYTNYSNKKPVTGKNGILSIRSDYVTYGGQSQYRVHLQFNKLKVK